MATPFIGEKFTFTQPDGSKLEVRGWGNQYVAHFETLDGFPITKDAVSGFWEVAQLSSDGQRLEPVPGARTAADGGRSLIAASRALDPATAQHVGALRSPLQPGSSRWEQRRKEHRTRMRAVRASAGAGAGGAPEALPPQRTTVGDYFGLCLLIDFIDEPATIPQAEVEHFCNQPGYTGFGNNGSVYDYFLDNSLGRLRYKNVVTPYYRAQFPKSHYTDPSIPYGQRAIELIREALAHWLANGFDFSALTADTAGNVYATNVFYAGPRTNNWSEGLWPHAWNLGVGTPLLPGKAAFDYQITDLGSALTLGTFCHETGHLLCDYPDLYDYASDGIDSGGVGAFCLMCRGGNINPNNPAQISAYLKRVSGWTGKLTSLETKHRVALCAGKNEFAIHRKSATEYFLVENRIKSGRDASLPDAGLAIWHVDELGDNSNEQMTEVQHYELSLEQADGLFEFEHTADFWGDTDDLFARRGRFNDRTTPNSKWWDGTSSCLTIDRIAIGESVAKFRCVIAGSHPSSADEA